MDTLDKILRDLIDTGVIFLTKEDVINPEAVDKFAYARKRLREEQRDKLPEVKSQLTKLIQEARKEQSTLTSRWIEKHIARLAKDPNFKNETAGVAFTYAQDQARQGRIKALKQE